MAIAIPVTRFTRSSIQPKIPTHTMPARLMMPTSWPPRASASAEDISKSGAAAMAHSEMNIPLIDTSARPMNAAP